jgi:hypothetical protein
MIKLAPIVAFVAAVVTATPVFAGAFGVEMGAKPAALGAKPMASDNPGPLRRYTLDTAPKPNSAFESYVLFATTATGVCKITAIGRDHEGDINGLDLRGQFEEFSKLLTDKYGASEAFDYLKAGSIWNDPQDFAMALKQKERSLVSFWASSTGAKLPGDLVGISLEGHASGPSATYLTLSYEFANFDACADQQKTSNNSGL